MFTLINNLILKKEGQSKNRMNSHQSSASNEMIEERKKQFYQKLQEVERVETISMFSR
jgi:glutamyl-tRNA reductase